MTPTSTSHDLASAPALTRRLNCVPSLKPSEDIVVRSEGEGWSRGSAKIFGDKIRWTRGWHLTGSLHCPQVWDHLTCRRAHFGVMDTHLACFSYDGCLVARGSDLRVCTDMGFFFFFFFRLPPVELTIFIRTT
jgi:hypothetical protein